MTAVVNENGKALNFVLVEGQEHDVISAIEALENVEGKIVLGDKAYDCARLRSFVRENGGLDNMPNKANRVSEYICVKSVGKIRHLVENYFCRIKRFRRVNTRYDKLPETCMAFVTIATLADYMR